MTLSIPERAFDVSEVIWIFIPEKGLDTTRSVTPVHVELAPE